MTESISNALGRKVVAVDTAEEIGEINSFVVDTAVDRIERLHIGGRRSHALFTEWHELEAFGNDAVMVTKASAPTESDEDRDIDTARGNIDIMGARVLDTSGFEHGTVADVTFDTDDGAIVTITTTSGDSVDRDNVASLGSYALVVRS